MYLSTLDKQSFSSIILLDAIINKGQQFKIVANGNDKLLEPLFVALLAKGYVSISGGSYKVTPKGEEAFDNFMQRYSEFLKFYDVFSFVDLELGEFAFSRYFDFSSDGEWDMYKSNDRFEDLRIAVAIYKRLNPAEIVFMSFINEDRFDTEKFGWQMDLASDKIWQEIENIVQTAIKPAEVGDDAMKDMIAQGSDLVVWLIKEEGKRNVASPVETVETTVVEETVVEEVNYYQPYCYDPFYISPIWLIPLFLW